MRPGLGAPAPRPGGSQEAHPDPQGSPPFLLKGLQGTLAWSSASPVTPHPTCSCPLPAPSPSTVPPGELTIADLPHVLAVLDAVDHLQEHLLLLLHCRGCLPQSLHPAGGETVSAGSLPPSPSASPSSSAVRMIRDTPLTLHSFFFPILSSFPSSSTCPVAPSCLPAHRASILFSTFLFVDKNLYLFTRLFSIYLLYLTASSLSSIFY